MATKSIRLTDGTDTFLPEAAESGSGYCKFADGTLIQYGVGSTGAITGGNTIQQTLTFPYAFANIPYASITLGTTAISDGSRMCTMTNISRTGATVVVYDKLGTAGMGYYWLAIGRWK